jgi:hypothetical protein
MDCLKWWRPRTATITPSPNPPVEAVAPAVLPRRMSGEFLALYTYLENRYAETVSSRSSRWKPCLDSHCLPERAAIGDGGWLHARTGPRLATMTHGCSRTGRRRRISLPELSCSNGWDERRAPLPGAAARCEFLSQDACPSGGVHVAAEPSETTSATTVAAATEKEAAAAESPGAVADPVSWEFRLTADRRRILVPVNRTTDPEFV